jgi:hypothetical protein
LKIKKEKKKKKRKVRNFSRISRKKHQKTPILKKCWQKWKCVSKRREKTSQ